MYIFIALVLCILVYEVKIRSSKKYKAVMRFPACFPELPVVGSLYRFVGSSESILKTLVHAERRTIQLGGATRLVGLNHYFIALSNAPDIAEVLRHYLNKDSNYRLFQILTGNGSVFVLDASIAKVRRAALLPSFSSEKLGRYVDCIWAEAVKLTELLAPHAGQGSLRLDNYLGVFGFNTIIRTADVNEIKEEYSTEAVYRAFYKSFNFLSKRFISTWKRFDFLYQFTRDYRDIKEFVNLLYKYADRAQEIRRIKLKISSQNIKDDKKENKINAGFFDGLISSNLNKSEVSEEILILLGATEEAAIAIGYTLTLLAMYPSIQDKVYDEILNVFGNSDRPLVKDDLMRLHYLDIVIKESQRLYPPVPFILRKAHKDITLSSGMFLPAGVGIAVGIYSLHRSPVYWGGDAEHFDPERFLPERLATVVDNAFMLFSYGPRACPAYKLANHIIKICVCAILRKYKVVRKPASTPAPKIRTKFELNLRPVDGFEMELKNRR